MSNGFYFYGSFMANNAQGKETFFIEYLSRNDPGE
jgi:hypothetical protein